MKLIAGASSFETQLIDRMGNDLIKTSAVKEISVKIVPGAPVMISVEFFADEIIVDKSE